MGEYSTYLRKKVVEDFDERWQEETESNVRYFLENPLELIAFSGEIQSQIRMLKLTSEDLNFPDYAMYGIADVIAEEQKGAIYQENAGLFMKCSGDLSKKRKTFTISGSVLCLFGDKRKRTC